MNEEISCWPIDPEVSAEMERSNWTPEEALRWYAAGRHYDTVPNGDGTSSARILDNGAVASNALKSLSREYAEHKGDVALQEPAPLPAYPQLPAAVGVAQFSENELIGANSLRYQAAHNDDGLFDEYNVEVFTADQLRAFADATHALRAQAAPNAPLYDPRDVAFPAAPAAPQPAVQQGDAEVLLIAAVDEWFAKNTGLGGCSDKDVQELQAIFAAHPAAPVAQGDAEDAARYRWLRCSRQGRQRAVFLDSETVDELDAAIDAARSQAKEEA